MNKEQWKKIKQEKFLSQNHTTILKANIEVQTTTVKETERRVAQWVRALQSAWKFSM